LEEISLIFEEVLLILRGYPSSIGRVSCNIRRGLSMSQESQSSVRKEFSNIRGRPSYTRRGPLIFEGLLISELISLIVEEGSPTSKEVPL
jgi:hypothetical protein